jgi:ribosome maturation factor RimP
MCYPVGFRPLFLLGESQLVAPRGTRDTDRLCATAMDSRSVAERVREFAEQVAIDHGLELVHVEMIGPEGHPIVRLFIDKPDGVTHQDCSDVSHHLGTVLDVEDFIHSAYTLEVSSPGLERGLYNQADYERFAGNQAKIKARTPVNGQRNFRGRIVGASDGTVVIEDLTSGRVAIAINEIAKAHLEVNVEDEFRRAREQTATDRHLTRDSDKDPIRRRQK